MRGSAFFSQYLDPANATALHLRGGPGPLLGRLATRPFPAVPGGPVVSVIMVASNAQDTIGYAARSILEQTWTALELIIVDDASTDGTWAVADALSKSDARVKLLRNPVRVGPYVSRNRALVTAVAGEYVTTQDADEINVGGLKRFTQADDARVGRNLEGTAGQQGVEKHAQRADQAVGQAHVRAQGNRVLGRRLAGQDVGVQGGVVALPFLATQGDRQRVPVVLSHTYVRGCTPAGWGRDGRPDDAGCQGGRHHRSRDHRRHHHRQLHAVRPSTTVPAVPLEACTAEARWVGHFVGGVGIRRRS